MQLPLHPNQIFRYGCVFCSDRLLFVVLNGFETNRKINILRRSLKKQQTYIVEQDNSQTASAATQESGLRQSLTAQLTDWVRLLLWWG